MSQTKNRLRNWAFIVVVIFLLSISLLIIYNKNFNEPKQEDAGGPVFSVKGGFYKEPFELSITAPKDATIYYTLDSSDPTENSFIYDSPIALGNATNNPNNYSMIKDVSVGLYTELIKENNTLDGDYGFKLPDYLVDKCNIVKAFYIDKDGKRSDTTVSSYFVGDDFEKYSDCLIISITTDPSNLFDYDKGIYVTGKTFDNYIKKNELNKWWRYWEANYTQRGSDWERECNVEIYNKEQVNIINNKARIEIQGNISRAPVPRSLNIYFDDEDVSNNNLSLLFDSGIKPTKINFSAGGNKRYSKFNDYMMNNRVSGLEISTMEYKPCVLFLEGEYWGFYWMCDAYDDNYISYNYDVDKNNIIMIKNNDLEIGDDALGVYYTRMKYEITSSDMTKKESFDRACELIDIDSFIDYYSSFIYIARQEDWPKSNKALWRTISNDGSKYGDCKWRWMVFDCNSKSMKEDLIEHNTLDYVIKNDELFSAFWQNELFRERFKDKILEISDKCFEVNEMNDFIEEYNTKYFKLLSDSWKRFHGKDNNKIINYINEMNGYKAFFEKRKNTVESWFLNNDVD